MEKQKRWPKGKKRKPYSRVRDESAPRKPQNAYVRFMNEKREGVASKNPKLSVAEVTKILGSQWTSLSQEDKKKYLVAAENDKARYLQKLKAHPPALQAKASNMPGPSSSNAPPLKECSTPQANPGDIPIFTEAFLDHNKAKDAELRQLRKSNAEYAEQSAMLQRHIDNLRAAISRLDSETQSHVQNNAKLKNKLQNMRELIVKTFKDLPIPGSSMLPTAKNADTYMKSVQDIMEHPSDDNKDFISAVKEIVLKKRKRDFQTYIMCLASRTRTFGNDIFVTVAG